MEEMKQTGVQWIGEIPSTWNTKRIKYMATLKGRIGWQGLTSEEYQDEGAYLITGVDFADGGIDWENCVHVPMKRWEEAKDIQIEEGDLLITKDGTIGKVAIVKNMPGETSLNSGVLRIIPVEGYSRRFLFWVIKSAELWNWFNYKNSGNSTIVHLYQGDFAEFLYAFPNYEEQEHIADYLDSHCGELDSIIAGIEKQIKILSEYKQSLITETVTKGLFKDVPMQDCSANDLGIIPKHWNVMRLGYVSSMQNGYVGPTVDILVDEDEGQMYIQSLHVKNGKIVFGNDFYVTEKWGRTRPKLYEGDVVIVQTGDIGQVGLVAKEYDGKNCHALIICHTNKEIMCPEYLIYYFMSDIGQWQLLQYETGTTLKHLNSTKIKDSKVLIPPIDEQKDIATFLTDKCETVDSIIAVKTQQLESMRSHKQSLIFEYITGKKRVKEVR